MARTVGNRIISAIALLCTVGILCAQPQPDTLIRAHHLRPLEVLGVKLMPDGSIAAGAVTMVDRAQIKRLGIESAMDLSTVAPNFFMPHYGSRMTSSIYVRGLGARIDQPIVSLSVDNIPYLNKDSYDFDIFDIRSIEVLRGAQSVLNGRNTMGGQINVHTMSPLQTQGLRTMAEYSTANTVRAAAAYYGRLLPDLGMSLSAQYRHTDGFHTNTFTGKAADAENSGALRWKTQWRPSAALSVTNTAAATYARQSGYPYQNVNSGLIAYNDTCSYKRTSLADAVTIAWAGKRVVVTSVSSFGYMDDCMNLDQDFLPDPYFTLTQKRLEWTFTQDLFTRGTRGVYSWLGGVYAFGKSTAMHAPVRFKDVGIARLIEQHRNDANPDYPIRWDSRDFILGSRFSLRSFGAAAYHQSKLKIGQWSLNAGVRLDVERTSLRYNSVANTGFSTLHVLPDGTEESYSHTKVNIDDTGSLHDLYLELLPQATVTYDGIDDFRPYITFSKAYKSGGFNTQMFSDVLQQRIMSLMGMSSLYELAQVVRYKPEKSFNYEIGTQWNYAPANIGGDACLFYILCLDQQLTVFPPGSTTGRLMTNAGRTRSFGAEITARYAPHDDVLVTAAYGYTNARFRRYNDGRQDYRGKHLPYAPANTLMAELSWNATSLTVCGILPSVTLTARCAGPIWWNESNSLSQNFYATANVRLNFSREVWNVSLWADNFTNTRYYTFYFKSIGNEFVQVGAPARLGVSLRVNLQ